jgi:hypothetical protein
MRQRLPPLALAHPCDRAHLPQPGAGSAGWTRYLAATDPEPSDAISDGNSTIRAYSRQALCLPATPRLSAMLRGR